MTLFHAWKSSMVFVLSSSLLFLSLLMKTTLVKAQCTFTNCPTAQECTDCLIAYIATEGLPICWPICGNTCQAYALVLCPLIDGNDIEGCPCSGCRDIAADWLDCTIENQNGCTNFECNYEDEVEISSRMFYVNIEFFSRKI